MPIYSKIILDAPNEWWLRHLKKENSFVAKNN